MASKKSIGEKLSVLAKSTSKSQTQIAANLKMPHSQINRFFNGHCDLSSTNLILVLNELGIDIEELISKELLRLAGDEDSAVNDLPTSVNFLLNSLDAIGKQTLLAQILWAAKKTSKKKIPEKIEAIVRKEISLI